MKKIIITGAAGRLGSILKDLRGYSLTFVDKLPMKEQNSITTDIANEFQRLIEIFQNHWAVIHLAWDRRENWRSEISLPENKIMAENVYQAAVQAKVKRVIIASSVHANKYLNWKGRRLITPDDLTYPDSPYGATKIWIETLGKFYARKHGLEVICLRFGGVKEIRDEPDYSKIWLSEKDYLGLIKRCLKVKKIPGNFCIINAISNNAQRVHDWINPVGWIPKDDASQKFK